MVESIITHCQSQTHDVKEENMYFSKSTFVKCTHLMHLLLFAILFILYSLYILEYINEQLIRFILVQSLYLFDKLALSRGKQKDERKPNFEPVPTLFTAHPYNSEIVENVFFVCQLLESNKAIQWFSFHACIWVYHNFTKLSDLLSGRWIYFDLVLE